MHRRKTIRDAMVAKLAGLDPSIPVRIDSAYPWNDLPGVNIVTGDESVEDDGGIMNPDATGQWIQYRDLEFDVEVRALADPPSDVIDAVCFDVETLLAADLTLGGAALKFEYVGSTAELAGDAEKPIALRTLNYLANYRVNAKDPQ